ncbi:TIGR02680 family protein [Nocardia goodfellowii]
MTIAVPRWVPTRAGILNVWRYYDEVFEFHEGRLLLRGPNGSGKSKALELLLPFLFDASLRANRLSTFGTGERSMHWNMMGEGTTGATRVGYVWLEFRLADRWFTCGARLQATSRTTTVQADYFTTELRIGALELTDAGRPLTRAALADRIGTHGKVCESASEYRDRVRSTLFPNLTEQRYDALITALLQLRTPKLSQRLDPALLSTLLSRALPPLGQTEIADLAEGFERLDAQRERLVRLDAEVKATGTLARQQRTYAQRVLRAGAAALLTVTSELDKLSTAAKQSADELGQTGSRKAEAEQLLAAQNSELSSARSRRDGLMKSEAYKQGLRLDELRKQTRGAQRRALDSEAAAQRERGRAATDSAQHAAALEDERGYEGHATACGVDAQQSAHRVGMVAVYGELAGDPESDGARALLRGAVRGRRDQLAAMASAFDRHERAVDARTEAEHELDSARTAFTEADDANRKAVQQREGELEALRDRLQEWAVGCRALSFPDPAVVAELAGRGPALIDMVSTAVTAASETVSVRIALWQQQYGAAEGARDELVADRARLESEQDIPPAAPIWRTADRSRRAGAPLWRLVDFAADLPAAAAIEAALESAGLLDAWVGPRGDIEGHDLFADHTTLAPVDGRSLAEVLVPVPDTGVDTDAVHRLLSTIAFGEKLPADSVVAVSAEGSWRVGNLTGSWSKRQAAYIGAATRERARQHRIRELGAAITVHEQTLATLRAEHQQLTMQRELIGLERAALPARDLLIAAENEVTRTEFAVSSADGQVRARVAGLAAKEAEVKQALHVLSVLAAETALPTERGALTALGNAIDDFAGQSETWLDAHRALAAARRITADRAGRAEESAAAAVAAAEAATTAADEHRALATELEAIEGSVGRDYREVLAEIDQLRTRIDQLTDSIEANRATIVQLAGELGSLKTKHYADIDARDRAATNRDHLTTRFRHVASGTFPADSAIPDLETFRETLSGSEGVRAARNAARLIAATWPTIPHEPAHLGEALRRLTDSVHECRTALSTRADLDLETDNDIQVFTAVVDGIRVGCAELLKILTAEADQSKNEITERERELFDQTLTGDTRRHLAARIRQANDLVDGMNARLERVRTASNVAVQLVWQVRQDLPPGTKAARDLLLKDPIRLSDADRDSLHQFLRDRIEEAKADDTAASWEQQLAQVFDYTAWHRFVVKIDRGNGEGYKELTKKLHGALSGGEKAIALHLPLFAAVAAHYQAAPSAPRAILLDEVFVGVDTVNRGQIFALLSALDLDLMLTSDHEWCTYAELSGIGIHQILTGDGDDAVTTARFTWDGRELLPG